MMAKEISLATILSPREVADLFQAEWPEMAVRPDDEDIPAVRYDGRDLPRSFFLYRDAATARTAEDGGPDECYDGMVHVVGRTVVVPESTPWRLIAALGPASAAGEGGTCPVAGG